MCILLSLCHNLSKRPCHLANHNLSKPGTLLQAPTLVHKLHTSQVFAYKVRLGVYPPLTLALSKTPCLHESLQVWNTLVASNTYAYAPHIPSLCIQGRDLVCILLSPCLILQHHLGSTTRPLSYHIRYVLVCIHCKACPFAKKA